MTKDKEALRKKLDEFQEMLDDWKRELDDEDYSATGDTIFVPYPVYVPIQPYDAYDGDPCKYCSNNPMNNPNASGVCVCSLPSMFGKFKITC